MKLLFDQNLSPRLPRLLADLYPDSAHIRELGMRDATDTQIWVRIYLTNQAPERMICQGVLPGAKGVSNGTLQRGQASCGIYLSVWARSASHVDVNSLPR